LNDPTYIGPTLKIEGEITADEDVRIDGYVKGPLSVGGHRVTLGEMALVLAETVAREVVVYGALQGDIQARDRIEIKKNACVEGDITTAEFLIEDGAYVKGCIEVDENEQVGADLGTLLGRSEAR
jgi:cytoskeletal protein CcmA (bactofilin family)